LKWQLVALNDRLWLIGVWLDLHFSRFGYSRCLFATMQANSGPVGAADVLYPKGIDSWLI
jgi:hypothetical protein